MKKFVGYFKRNWRVILSLAIGLLFLLFPWIIACVKFLILPVIAAVRGPSGAYIAILPAVCLLGAVIGAAVGLVLLKLLKVNPGFVLLAAVIVALLWVFILDGQVASIMLGCSSALMLMLIPFIHRLFPSLAESSEP